MDFDLSTSSAKEETLYFSELAREQDMREIVELFVQELPSRLAALRRAAGTHDWEEVCRLAHQLKGASGSYGFPNLMQEAARVERAARDHNSELETQAALEQLATICAGTRPGLPAAPTGNL